MKNKRVLNSIHKKLKQRKKKYSKSILATNKLHAKSDIFRTSYLFKKPGKRRIYNPNAKYFEHGGPHGGPGDPPLSYAEKMKAYADSSALYNAYNFQRNKMKEIYPYILDDLAEELQYPGGGKALKAARDKNFGEFGKRIYGADWSFNKRRNYDDKDYREKVITDYYKKLIGSDPNFKIGDYSSPDLLHKTIKPIGTYFDGIASSPIYRKPTKPIKIPPPPPPPQYEIEPVYIEPEIDKLPIIQPSFTSNPVTGEIVTPEEEGIDYERKFGVWLQDKAQKDAKLKTLLKYKIPEFFNPKKSRVSQYYRTPKRLRAGFYNEAVEEEQIYPEGFVPMFQDGGSTGPCPKGMTYDPETYSCIPYKAYAQKYNVSEEDISNVNAEYNENLKWFKDYYNSPRYKEMVRDSVEASGGPGSVDEKTQNIITSRDAQLFSQEPVVVTSKDDYMNHYNDDEAPLGSSDSATGKISIVPHHEHYDKGFREGTLTHEISHSSDRPFYHSDYWIDGLGWLQSSDWSDNSRQIPQSDIDYIKSKKPKYLGDTKEYWDAKKYWDWLKENDIDAYRKYQQEYMGWTDYLSNPTETRARLNDLRKVAQDRGIYDPFTEKIDENAFRKLKDLLDSDEKSKVKGLRELRDAFSDEEIKWMLNNISKNEQTSNVLDHQYAKEGGSVELGDEVDEATMKRLKKLGYTFEEI